MRDDNPTSYGSITRIFHWVMAVLIGWQILKIFDRIADGEHWVGQTLVPWHISVGTLLLALIIARIVWVAKQRVRPVQEPATALLVKAGHFLLYVGMAAMPVTGVLTMLGGGYGWTAFGIEIVAKGDKIPWASSVGSLHSPIAWLLVVLIIGHIGMALLHHFIKKDEVMRRMI